LIKGFNTPFFVLLCFTKASRCLFGIEQDNGSTPEQLAEEWNRLRWHVLRPPSTRIFVVKTLEYGQDKFEIEVFAKVRDSGGADVKLELKML
jgi:hypothetical protein